MLSHEKTYGLLGKSLGHSFSKEYFTDKFSRLKLNYSYHNIELDNVGEIVSFVQGHENLKGFNVTVPYKESVIAFLDDIDDTAKEVGAVNTVKVGDTGTLKGFNTDVTGFQKLLDNITQTCSLKENKALILGSGGASKAVQYVLKKNNFTFDIVSRTASVNTKTYKEINEMGFKSYTLIINTTPVGMSPDIDKCLELPYSTIEPHHVFIDLIYNPEETLFLKTARLKKAATFNWLTMLHEQAEAAWDIWRT